MQRASIALASLMPILSRQGRSTLQMLQSTVQIKRMKCSNTMKLFGHEYRALTSSLMGERNGTLHEMTAVFMVIYQRQALIETKHQAAHAHFH